MRRLTLSAVALLLLGAPALLEASERPGPPCDHWLTPEYQGDDPRMRLESVGGRSVFVLVPPGYDESNERYPVVYLIHGGVNDHHGFPAQTDVVDFSAAQPPGRRAIVVMPDGTLASAWSDWRNGALLDESLFVDQLLPFIDANYRTIADGRHRAIAGFSGGGWGAALLAERHPDLFAAYGAFSAMLDVDPEHVASLGPGGASLVYAVSMINPYCEDDSSHIDPFGLAGDPVLEPVWIRDANPPELAGNLVGTNVSIYSGDGQPCDLEDVQVILDHAAGTGPEAPPWPLVEGGVKVQAEAFSAALTEAGIPNRLETNCGIHTYRYVERSLHDWWDVVFNAFGSPALATFKFRDADSSFSVWGWTFEADPTRAPEFLDVTDASEGGVTLTGSGVATVTTAALFAPGQIVALTGSVEPSVVADSLGRITFPVDLGPAHQHQQYSIPARALEALGGYWTTKTVTFEP